MNYWYVSRRNEIFLDIDSAHKSIKHCYSRLLGAITSENLPVKEFWKFPSNSSGHLHIIIILSKNLPAIERYTWAVVLRSDIYRACATIFRELRGVGSPDLLIANRQYHRTPDCTCECTEKHRANVMRNCLTAKLLRGDNRLEGFFGIPANLHKLKVISRFENNFNNPVDGVTASV